MIRIADFCDLQRILEIYSTARKFMSENGNPTQWAGGYPQKSLVESDIESGYLHVLEADGKIHAVFALLPNGDSVYDKIDGKWQNDEPYAAVHRVASSGELRGAGRKCLCYAIDRYGNVKIDTHKDNAPMRHVLLSLGFCECGTVTIENGEQRIAYQHTRAK